MTESPTYLAQKGLLDLAYKALEQYFDVANPSSKEVIIDIMIKIGIRTALQTN